MIVVDTNFVYGGKRFTATAEIVEREQQRCAHAPRYRVSGVKVTTQSGYTSEPLPGGGLYDAALAAIHSAWRARSDDRSDDDAT